MREPGSPEMPAPEEQGKRRDGDDVPRTFVYRVLDAARPEKHPWLAASATW